MNKEQELINKISIYIDMNQNIVLTMDTQNEIDMIIDAVIEEKKDTYKTIKVDMLKMITPQDISDTIIHQLNTFLDKTQSVEEFYDKKDDYLYLCYALELPQELSKTINTKFIFVINELEQAMNFNTDFKILEVMRSIFQHQNDVIHIFTGMSKTLMKNIFHNRREPFFQFVIEVK